MAFLTAFLVKKARCSGVRIMALYFVIGLSSSAEENDLSSAELSWVAPLPKTFNGT
jgi:hypothetical protein